MPDESPVTRWITDLKQGDRSAAQRIWEQYLSRLMGLARKKLQDASRRAADEEDVALSAFHSFCRAAERGRFPRLEDRDDLWQILVVITERKAVDLVNHERRQKRGGGKVQGESAIDAAGNGVGLQGFAGREPTPEFVAIMSEECRRLLRLLGDPDLESIALWKMEGYTNDEIAGKFGRTRQTVQRKLRLIRALWEEETR